MTINQSIVAETLKRFPDAATKTLARIAYRDNPSVFKDLESARSAFRCARGANGCSSRLRPSVIAPRPCRMAGNPFARIPEGKTHFEKWEAVQVTGPVRAIVLSDLHIPYHEKTPIVTALKWGKDNGANTILLNGDMADFFSISRWEKDPRKRRFAEELKTCKEFIQTLKALFPKARIIFKEGNHEERYTSYMFVKAPELLGVPEFDLQSILGLDGCEMVSEKRPVRLGDLNVIHGHEYKFAISNPVNAARGLFLRAKAYAMCGHFHQKSEHSENNVEQKSISTWSNGCLCDMHPDYAPLNNWSHGFAFVEVYRDGKFQVKNMKISHGKVY